MEKETAKISHHAAHLTPAHALAASVLPDIRGGCRTHPPPQDRYTRIHLPGNPTYRCSPA
ncbi:hypothetical protein ECDEC8B_1632 [Escherichia coli DEC8B]|nr:hypothetical protein ECDEC8B_1632 [Escherichia coli DEC8B]